MNLYSEKIQHLIEDISDFILIPDLILTKEGVACGDMIILSGQINNQVLNFHFESKNSCILCRASCQYFEAVFQNSTISYINEKVSMLIIEYISNPEHLFQVFDLKYEDYSNRFDCLISPLKLLLSFVSSLSTTSNEELNNELSSKNKALASLECDACVSACEINWGNSQFEKSKYQYIDYEPDYKKRWYTLAKVELNKEDIPLLNEACSNMNAKDYKFLSDYALDTTILSHLMKYSPNLINSNWKSAAYLIQKNEISKLEFQKIQQYIVENNLSMYFIKGCVTQEYYEFPSLRIRSDYDIISENCSDAFCLTAWLIQNGFAISPNMFSYKKVIHDGKTVISGHFHIQKTLDDTYLFDLDITFPGFPINRVDLYFPRVKNNKISVESQIIITLLHLYKHSNVYMKDINDLFYMLQQNDLDLCYIKSEIKNNKLDTFFQIAVIHIASTFPNGHQKLKNIVEYFDMDFKCLQKYPNWPYSNESHYQIKISDLIIRSQNRPDGERVFLHPVVVFNKELDMENFESSLDSVMHEKILDTIYKIDIGEHSFYYTPIGIFISSSIDTNKIKRDELIKTIKCFVEKIGNVEFAQVPYAIDYFYVRVI